MKNVRRHNVIAFRGVTGAAAGDNIMEYYIFAQYIINTGNVRPFYMENWQHITISNIIIILFARQGDEVGGGGGLRRTVPLYYYYIIIIILYFNYTIGARYNNIKRCGRGLIADFLLCRDYCAARDPDAAAGPPDKKQNKSE